jgi:hypothetical protein
MRSGWILVAASLLTLSCTAGARAADEPPVAANAADTSSDPSQWRRIALVRALDAAAAIDDPYRRAQAFAAVARAQVSIEDIAATDRTIHQALAAAEQITEPAFRGWVLHDIAQAQIAADDPIGAKQTAESIAVEGPQGETLVLIADVQLRGGSLEAAQSTATKIRDVSAKSEVLRQIVVVQCARGEIDAARRTLRDIDDPYLSALAYGDIAIAQVFKGDVAAAYATAAAARRASRSEVYARIALAQVDNADRKGAMQSLQKIADPLQRAATQGRIAAQRASIDAVEARQLLASAVATVEQFKGKQQQQRILTLAQLARLQAVVGDRAASRDTLQRAREQAKQLPAGRARDETFDYIARGQSRADDPEGALDAALSIDDRVTRALLVRDIVAVQPDATSASASASSAAFTDPLIDAAAQFGLLSVQVLRPGKPLSLEAIDAARAAVRRIEDLELKPAAFSALAAARVKAGDVPGSWEIFQEALASAEAMPRADRRAAAYVRIVNALNDRLMFLGRPAGYEEKAASSSDPAR